ncbi:MAG: cytochrome P450 [Pseudomonadota bacterium]
MKNAPVVDVDMAAFTADPYPTLKKLRGEAPIAFIQQLGGIAMSRRDDIVVCEKNIEVFSSHQPNGLMNVMMGHNMMRKDGDDHMVERRAMFPTVSPKTVRDEWSKQFAQDANALLDEIEGKGHADLVSEYAMPLSAHALRAITGLKNMPFHRLDHCSQAMIDGVSNFAGDPETEARCHAATAEIDAAIDERLPIVEAELDSSMLSVLTRAGQPMDSVRANIKLAISGGQNEPRDAIAGCIWALTTHPAELEKVRSGAARWQQAFEEYARWISPIGMSPRRVAAEHTYGGVTFEPEDKVFFLFGSANRDEEIFEDPDSYIVDRDTAKSIPFGAGPHFCAGAWASRSLISDVALPFAFDRLKGLRLKAGADVPFAGWAFRGPLRLDVEWDV